MLVHGFGARPTFMRRLASSLKRKNLETECWGYRSLRVPIEDIADQFAEHLRSISDRFERVHLVTHSMGCIVARAALTKHSPNNLGRWVMLAPPNRGAYSADTWAWPLRLIFPPVKQLSTSADSFVNQLPQPSNIEFGVIGASFDWIVRTKHTHLPGEQDHFMLPCIHSQLMFDRGAAKQIRHFLDHGRFERN